MSLPNRGTGDKDGKKRHGSAGDKPANTDELNALFEKIKKGQEAGKQTDGAGGGAGTAAVRPALPARAQSDPVRTQAAARGGGGGGGGGAAAARPALPARVQSDPARTPAAARKEGGGEGLIPLNPQLDAAIRQRKAREDEEARRRQQAPHSPSAPYREQIDECENPKFQQQSQYSSRQSPKPEPWSQPQQQPQYSSEQWSRQSSEEQSPEPEEKKPNHFKVNFKKAGRGTFKKIGAGFRGLKNAVVDGWRAGQPDDPPDDSSDDDDDDDDELKAKRDELDKRVGRYLHRLTGHQLSKRNLMRIEAESTGQDSRLIPLRWNETLLSSGWRVIISWLLFIIAICLALSAILDFTKGDKIKDRLDSIQVILNELEFITDAVLMIQDTILIVPIAYIILASIRVVLLWWMIQQDTGDSRVSLQESTKSSVGYKLIYFLSWIILLGQVAQICIVHKNFQDIKANFENNFGELQERYLVDPVKKRKLDRFQRDAQCCGSSGFASWFDVNLYDQQTEVQEQNRTLSSLFKGTPLMESDKLLNYWFDRMVCHYHHNITNQSFEFATVSTDWKRKAVKHYLLAHGPGFVPSSVPKLPADIHTLMHRIKSVPLSCCKPNHEGICFFYNIDNRDGFYQYRPDNAGRSIHEKGCNQELEPALKVAKALQTVYEWRIGLECLFILVLSFVSTSFESFYEMRTRPMSITAVPYCTGVLMAAGAFIYWALIHKKLFYAFDGDLISVNSSSSSPTLASTAV